MDLLCRDARPWPFVNPFQPYLYSVVITMNTETQNIRDEVHADTGFKGEQSLQ